MQDPPSITIVMPSYNQAVYLETAICSILEQSYPRLELILMDGGSTDGSLDIIQRYSPDLSFWKSHPDNGQADALYQGFSLATGDLIGWLNSDDVLLPGAFKHLVDAYHSQPDAGLFAGNLLWIDGQDRIIRCKRHPSSVSFFIRHGIYAISQPGSLFRRSDYLASGGLNTSLRYVMDADLYIRLLEHGSTHVHVNHWLAAFRLHGESKTVSKSQEFSREFEQTRLTAWPSVKPSRSWKVLYKLWQMLNGNFIRMGFETQLARGKRWQSWVKVSG